MNTDPRHLKTNSIYTENSKNASAGVNKSAIVAALNCGKQKANLANTQLGIAQTQSHLPCSLEI